MLSCDLQNFVRTQKADECDCIYGLQSPASQSPTFTIPCMGVVFGKRWWWNELAFFIDGSPELRLVVEVVELLQDGLNT